MNQLTFNTMGYTYFKIEVIYQNKVLASDTFETNKVWDPSDTDRNLYPLMQFIIEHTNSEDLKKYQELEEHVAEQVGRAYELWDNDIDVQITPLAPIAEVITLSELSDYIWTETEAREDKHLTKYLEEAKDKFLKEFNKSELDDINLETVQTFFNKR